MKRALQLMMFGALAAACGPHPVNFVGRLSFKEDWGCGSPVETQSVSWSDCHAFKRHFDPMSGAPITTSSYAANAMRPLAATVELTYVTVDSSGAVPTLRVCSRSRFQSNEDGVFNMTMDGCGPGVHTTLVGRVYLQAPLRFAQDFRGYVRGLWRMDEGDRLLEDLPGFEVAQEHRITRDGVQYAIPVLTFRRDLVEGESSEHNPWRQNLGNQAFLSAADSDRYGYMRQVLSSYATVLELHRKLWSALGDSGDYTRKMMVVDPDLGRMYGLWFTDSWAHGGVGWMSVYRPDLERFGRDEDHDGRADTAAAVMRLLSETSTLSHELGHGIVGAYAPRTGYTHYEWAGPMIRPDGMQYDWGHSGGQYADMGTSYAEGIPNSLGQFLLNRCAGFQATYRPVGGAVTFTDNMWNPSAACDTNDFNACPMHHVRYQLRQRSVMDGTTAFNDRVTRLRALTAAATGMGPVTSNSESRWGEFGCDLLDSDSNVSQATGRVAGRPYLSNFVYQVGQYFDGSTEAPLVSRYDDVEVAPETTALTMQQLLDSMANFCGAGGCDVPAPYGAAYNEQRLKSTGGKLSPQAMGRYLVDHGLMTDAQLVNLLKSNFMETAY